MIGIAGRESPPPPPEQAATTVATAVNAAVQPTSLLP